MSTNIWAMRADKWQNICRVLEALGTAPDTPLSARKIAVLDNTPSVSGVHGVLVDVKLIINTVAALVPGQGGALTAKDAVDSLAQATKVLDHTELAGALACAAKFTTSSPSVGGRMAELIHRLCRGKCPLTSDNPWKEWVKLDPDYAYKKEDDDMRDPYVPQEGDPFKDDDYGDRTLPIVGYMRPVVDNKVQTHIRRGGGLGGWEEWEEIPDDLASAYYDTFVNDKHTVFVFDDGMPKLIYGETAYNLASSVLRRGTFIPSVGESPFIGAVYAVNGTWHKICRLSAADDQLAVYGVRRSDGNLQVCLGFSIGGANAWTDVADDDGVTESDLRDRFYHDNEFLFDHVNELPMSRIRLTTLSSGQRVGVPRDDTWLHGMADHLPWVVMHDANGVAWTLGLKGAWSRSADPKPEQPKEEETKMPTPDDAKLDPIAAMIWHQIKPLVGGAAAVTTEMVDDVVQKAIKRITAPTITVVAPPAPPKEMERQHYMFELVLRILSCNVPLYLWGGAGSAKTSLLMACAEALTLPCNVVSFSRDTTRSQMMGYITLNGGKAPSLIHDAFTQGKFLVMDEFDAGGVGQLCLNALLANGVSEFYGEMCRAHPDFFVGVTANTPGTGAANGYRREPVDAATRDRLFVLELPVDEGLEAHICGVNEPSPKCTVGAGGTVTAEEWHGIIKDYRKAFVKLGVGTTLASSMRPAKLGSILAANGIGRHWLEEGLIRRGLAEDTWNKIKAETGKGV